MSGKCVLIVDDDKAIVETFEMILDDEGYNVLSAYTGAQGINLAAEQQPNLILLDLMLPDMSGAVVAQKIRSEHTLKHTPIVVVSASKDMNGVVARMDVQGCIAKPFTLTALLALVEQYVAA